MNENLPNEDLLMKYLDNEMSLSEKQQFENQIKENEELRARIESLILTRKSVEYYGIHDEVSKVRKEFQQGAVHKQAKVVKMKKPLRYIFMAAASVLLIGLVAIGYIFYQLSPEKVYNESFVSYNIPVSRGSNVSATEIESAYLKKDYTQVTELSKKGPATEKDRLLTGLSFMQLNQFNEASIQFGEILKNRNSNYRPDTEYYLALSHLRLKHYDEALDIFNKIHADESHLYHKQVSSGMLREIKLLKLKN